MIDLHSHLLPGLDDGAGDMAAALEMARAAAGSGTTHLLCTPHIHPGRYDNSPEQIAESCRQFRQALRADGIAVQVGWAAEVRFDMEIMVSFSAGALPYVGRWQDKDVLLLEFPHGEIPYGAERMTEWLLQRNVMPLIAHPERNKGVMRNPSVLRPLIAQGCLLQVTAGALAGRFGVRALELAEELLREDLVAVLASDAHNLQHRPPLLSEGFLHAARIVGDSRAESLVRDTPWEIAQGRFALP